MTTRIKDTLTHGPPATPITDLDTIPFPARHLVRQYTYGRAYDPRLKQGQFTSILASRGCPYSCRFCSRGSISMHRYRMRSPENILAELRTLDDQGYTHVAFVDDCFPVDTKQATALFDGIRNESFDFTFTITATRVDLADVALYKKMRQAGVAHLQFGLESGNQDVLDYYQKRTTIDAIRRAVHLSADAGFFTIGTFILGAPIETTAHLKQTTQFACTLPLDSVSFLPLRYMVGSALWDEAVTAGKIKPNEYCVTADKNKGLGTFTSQELLQYCHQAQRRFYSRPIFALRLLKHTIHNNDPSFLQSYLSYARSSLKGRF